MPTQSSPSRAQQIHRAGTLLMLALLSACTNTTSSLPKPQEQRITEYQSDYNQMSPVTQASVARGFISRADNFKAAYIALGKPDRITSSADGRVMVWTYHNFLPPQSEAAKQDAPKNVRGTAVSAVRSMTPLRLGATMWASTRPNLPAT